MYPYFLPGLLLGLLLPRLRFKPSRVRGQESLKAQLALKLAQSITLATKFDLS